MPTGIYKHKLHTEKTKENLREINLAEKNPWYGKHHTEETKIKLREKNLGKNSPRYGRTKEHDETSRKNSERMKKNNPMFDPKIAEKMRKTKLELFASGKIKITVSEETKRKIGEGNKGEKNGMWKGGISKKRVIIQNSFQYKEWREKVFKRDNYTCQNSNCLSCHNKKGVFLHPHHIKSFAKYSELIFDVNNGLTLCKDFHIQLNGKEEEYEKSFQNKIKNFH